MDASNTTPTTSPPPDGPPFDQPASQAQAKENLKYFRCKAEYSQTYLARALGMKPATVNRWESQNVDTYIPVNKLDTVAKLLHIDAKRLRIYHEAAETTYSSGVDYIDDPHQGRPIVLIEDPASLADYKNNIRFLRLKHGYTQRQLGEMLGLSHSIASTWENTEDAMPSRQQVERLAVLYSVDPRLIAPSVAQTIQPKPVDVAAVKGAMSPLNAARIQGKTDPDANRIYSNKSNVSLISMIAPNDRILNLQTRACAAAGPEFPVELQFDASVSELLGIHYTKGLAAAKVVGDSMFNPETGMGIPDGAIVLIDTTKRDLVAAIGKVVCFEAFGCYLIKRLRSNNGVMNAVSDNPHYFPLFYDNVDDIHLIGEVVSVLMSVE